MIDISIAWRELHRYILWMEVIRADTDTSPSYPIYQYGFFFLFFICITYTYISKGVEEAALVAED